VLLCCFACGLRCCLEIDCNIYKLICLSFKDWRPSSTCFEKISSISSVDSAYNEYHDMLRRNVEYAKSPQFFADVAHHFRKISAPKYSFRILSNLAEIDLENEQMLR